MVYNRHKQLVDTRKISGFVYALLMQGVSVASIEEAIRTINLLSDNELDSVFANSYVNQYASECARRLL